MSITDKAENIKPTQHVMNAKKASIFMFILGCALIVIILAVGYRSSPQVSYYANELNSQVSDAPQDNTSDISTLGEIHTTPQTYSLVNNQGSQYFASTGGTNVYPISCIANTRIKPENIIYFESIDELAGSKYQYSEKCY